MRFIIVLGQSLVRDPKDGSMLVPPTLQSRVDHAAHLFDELLQDSKTTADPLPPPVVLVSGADVSQLGVSEAQVMHDLLSQRPEMHQRAQIVKDELAQNTCQNAVNCLKIIQQQFLDNEKEVADIFVVSSAFHMPRVRYIFECVRTYLELDEERFVFHFRGAPNCLPAVHDSHDHRKFMDINDLGALERLKHELMIVAPGSFQDRHFECALGPGKIIPANEEKREECMATLKSEIVALQEELLQQRKGH